MNNNQIKMAETKKRMKRYTLDEVKDKFIGKRGAQAREQYELELKMEKFRSPLDIWRERNDLELDT